MLKTDRSPRRWSTVDTPSLRKKYVFNMTINISLLCSYRVITVVGSPVLMDIHNDDINMSHEYCKQIREPSMPYSACNIR